MSEPGEWFVDTGDDMKLIPDGLSELPIIVRSALVGAMYAGLAGCVLGLVLGLAAYPPTAWFAVLEVGVPSAILGAVVGCLAGIGLHVGGRDARRKSGP